MKILKKKSFCTLKTYNLMTFGILILLSFFFSSESYAKNQPPPFHLEGVKAAVLFDVTSGEFLYELNADEIRPPASMSKLMTYYLVMDAIKTGKISWDDEVIASKYAEETIGSRIRVKEGEVFTVKQLVHALMIISANDAAVMLAEHIAGTEEKFAMMMNQKAKVLGLSEGTQFINASGLPRADLKEYAPQTIKGETQLTARDMVLLANQLIYYHPEVLEIASIPTWQSTNDEEKIFNNSNWMLPGIRLGDLEINPFYYEGIDGLKTGYTKAAGQSFTGTAVRDEFRLISVVMGAETASDRFVKTKELLDFGFAHYGPVTLLNKGSSLEEFPSVRIENGKKREVRVVLASDIQVIDYLYREPLPYQLLVNSTISLPLKAPVYEGEPVGIATVLYKDKVIITDLVIEETVPALTLLEQLLQLIFNLLFSIFHNLEEYLLPYSYRMMMLGYFI